MRTAVVDTGLSNLDSVVRALEHCGADPVRVTAPDGLDGARRIVLPGVGAFGTAMGRLHGLGLVDALDRLVLGDGVPVLGICLGMQLMLGVGEEGGETKGLGWIEGRVVRLLPDPGERVPHVGWNAVDPTPGSAPFTDVEPGSDFYFVHSYHVVPDDPSVVAATTPFAGGFVSAVASGPCWGVQFHPEKSQAAGFAVLRAFLGGGTC
ncbi:MAG: imidazole glycerol phosphate synthase subunit HisH [Acidimicrobiales bacterium]|nr:imidazole glycerol phosphate synthase subunit HisH [Acidimicrobiales bacterium]